MRTILSVLLILTASATAEEFRHWKNDDLVYSTECSMEWSRSWIMFSVPGLLTVDSIRVYFDNVDIPVSDILIGLSHDLTPHCVPEILFSPEAGSTCETDTNAEAFYVTVKTDTSFQHDTLWAYIVVPDNNLRLTIPSDAHTYSYSGQLMSYEANVVLFGGTTSLPGSSVLIRIKSLFQQ